MTQRSIKSAERTLRLFELFSRAQARLTVGQVARGLAIPQPSTSMLLNNLAAMGYLEYEGATRTYAPTVRIALLGGWIAPQFHGARSLASRLDELQRKAGVHTYVGIQNGCHAQIVQVRGGDRDLNIDSGQMYSLTCSAVGQALLAGKPDIEVVKIVRRCNAEAEDDRRRVNELDFLATLAAVRRNGYAQASNLIFAGRSGLAVVIRPPQGLMHYAVGFGGPNDIMERKGEMMLRELLALRAAAEEPAQRLTLAESPEDDRRIHHLPVRAADAEAPDGDARAPALAAGRA